MSSKNIAANGVDYTHLLAGFRVGSPRGVCTNCGEAFTTDSGYDKHQKFDKDTQEVICKHPSKVGLVQGEDLYWKHPAPNLTR